MVMSKNKGAEDKMRSRKKRKRKNVEETFFEQEFG